ncbi:MAG: 2-dehydropantoate 2-reductase [Desulfocapsaceae bacterium]|nr:2-dehydropantoate 2-reductase [Desulfocapsaceae bacterium]
MRYVIVGPGALGCLVGAKLAQGAAAAAGDVWILDHDRGRAEQISRQGLVYEKSGRQQSLAVKATADPGEVGRADILFLCVKSVSVQSSLKFCRPLLQAQTLLIFMQNGIGHLDYRDQSGKAVPAFGCTSEGATSLGPGQVRHAGDGQTFLGFLDPPDNASRALLEQTAACMQAGGLKVSVSEDILTRLWAKLFVNVGINALTVIHDCRNGDLLDIAEVRREMRAAVAEAQEVALAKGISIINDPYETTVSVCRATALNISSMRQDVVKKRLTEIDAINGAVVREATKLGIKTPVNESLVRRIKAIERTYSL